MAETASVRVGHCCPDAPNVDGGTAVPAVAVGELGDDSLGAVLANDTR